MNPGTRRSALAVASILAVYAVWLLAVSPNGEFPLNDDWAYAWSVRRLLDTGHLRLSEWSSATLIFPVYWGTLFAKVAGGFSFTALRWSTLTMSVVGCLAVYDLLRQLDLPVRSAWLGTITLAVNPLFLYLSYTFLSDVFYFAPMVLSLRFYSRGVTRSSGSALLVGSLFAAVAYLARQVGIVLPVAAALALLLAHRRFRWRPVARVTLIPGVVFISHTIWLRYVHGLPWGFELNAVHNSLAALLRPSEPVTIMWRLLISMLYLGIFTVPVLAAVGPSVLSDRERFTRLKSLFGIWLVVLIPLVAVMVWLTGGPMPYLSNVINRGGIGALTLAGQKSPVTPLWVFWLVTVCAPLAGAAQGALWTDAVRNLRRQAPGTVLVIASGLMALLTALIVTLWDEYLIVFIPAALYLVLRLRPITARGALIGGSVCALMLMYGLREMADHMAWNAGRWSAGRQLLSQGIPPEDIDGGFEWIGWYEFESALPVAIANGKKGNIFGWMAVTPHKYRLAFSPVDGYDVLRSVPYRGWPLGPDGRVYILAPRRE